MSKLLERYVTHCLIKHLTDSNILERYQSAYKSHHSTETALVLVQNDILEALDQRCGVILVLLDMSTAFDTVDHQFFSSGRSQSVNVPGGASSKSSVACGVPQGSMLGPLLFSMYTAPIGDIIRRRNLSLYLYADDTQLYIKFEKTDETNRLLSLCRFENCINDVRVWMVKNLLKINYDKTVALVLGSRNNQAKHHITVIKIGDCDITPSPTARNIGAVFDSVT